MYDSYTYIHDVDIGCSNIAISYTCIIYMTLYSILIDTATHPL